MELATAGLSWHSADGRERGTGEIASVAVVSVFVPSMCCDCDTQGTREKTLAFCLPLSPCPLPQVVAKFFPRSLLLCRSHVLRELCRLVEVARDRSKIRIEGWLGGKLRASIHATDDGKARARSARWHSLSVVSILNVLIGCRRSSRGGTYRRQSLEKRNGPSCYPRGRRSATHSRVAVDRSAAQNARSNRCRRLQHRFGAARLAGVSRPDWPHARGQRSDSV